MSSSGTNGTFHFVKPESSDELEPIERPARKSEWEKDTVFLVEPSIWRFYRSRENNIRPVYSELVGACASLGAAPEILGRADDPLDIWLRDYAPIADHFFDFAPSYARGSYPQSAVEKARSAIERRTGRRYPRLSLTLDGGNLVHNGKIAILTEKVFDDNPPVSRPQIEAIIAAMGFERVVFIPVEPGDELGHADGILTFLERELLLVNDYRRSPLADYGVRLLRSLKRACLPAEMVPFPWSCTTKRQGKIWSAEGVYVNLLQFSRGIILPGYGTRNDEIALSRLHTVYKGPIVQVNATPLALNGGVFNCASWTI